MNRKIRVLGVAVIGALAMSAMGSATASAQQGVLTSDGPVTLDMTGIPGLPQEGITTFGERIECPGTTYTGHKYSVTPHALTISGSTTVTVTPQFKNCKFVSLPYGMTLLMNGCDYVFHIGATSSEEEYSLSTDIACPVGKAIEVRIYLGEAENILACRWVVNAQSGILGLAATNSKTFGDLRIAGAMKGIHVEQIGGLCPSETRTNGEFHMNLTAQGTNSEGAGSAISISD